MDDLKEGFPNIPQSIAGLGELSFNLWWSWHPATRMLFKRLDRRAWWALSRPTPGTFRGPGPSACGPVGSIAPAKPAMNWVSRRILW